MTLGTRLVHLRATGWSEREELKWELEAKGR